MIVIACAGKIIGSMSAARALGSPVRESFTVGVLMNTKVLSLIHAIVLC